MRDDSFDRTIERNYVQKWRFLIAEYELVKCGASTAFKRPKANLWLASKDLGGARRESGPLPPRACKTKARTELKLRTGNSGRSKSRLFAGLAP
ncbi:MAG: hypothetical protein P4M15_09165 [Alphaproteobacteria bacterium]|nr:hypothetical protein [Alphaproteobacteria bacterium]